MDQDSENIEEDLELLKANQHLERMREVFQQKEKWRGKRENNGLSNLLKPLQKQAKKYQRHPITEWFEIWNKVVGEEIAALTKVKELKNGFLKIEVSNPALRSELEAFYSADLLVSLQEEKPEILLRGLKFVLAGNT